MLFYMDVNMISHIKLMNMDWWWLKTKYWGNSWA